VLLGMAGLVHGLPSVKNSQWVNDPKQAEAHRDPLHTTPPQTKYSVVQPISPRVQWGDDGGYCGAMSIQEIALGQGAWISQQQVRDHAVPGGGHDNEILETNIGVALTNLHLTFEGFQYKTLPSPQADSYRAWIKKHLLQGHGIVWMIMLSGGHYPVYEPLYPYGFYSHVEPVYGLYTNHPLNDEQWYPDDYVAHSTDADSFTYYRTFDSLPANVDARNNSLCGEKYLGYPCIYVRWGFGWAITGVSDTMPGLPLSLHVDSISEPNYPLGAKPANFHGTIVVTGLEKGKQYDIFRWDSAETAYDYAKANISTTFSATDVTYTFNDPRTILSSTATYYRCLAHK